MKIVIVPNSKLILHFNSVEQILTQLEQQPGWEKFRDYRQLLKCWHNTVNQNTAKHTRPLYITRQVLWVATSSAARAQELSFQRYSLLKKLNNQLPFTLKDIRFTSSGWHQATHQENTKEILFKIPKQQKSKNIATEKDLVEEQLENELKQSSPSTKAKIVAKRWLEKVNQSQSSWLSCPNCGSQTSSAEIERWNMCYLCIAQKWSREYRPASFPEIK